MSNVRYVEYLMPVLVEVNVANKEVNRVIQFPDYIKPTGAVFEDDRTTQIIPAEKVECQQAIELAENEGWPTWETEHSEPEDFTETTPFEKGARLPATFEDTP